MDHFIIPKSYKDSYPVITYNKRYNEFKIMYAYKYGHNGIIAIGFPETFDAPYEYFSIVNYNKKRVKDVKETEMYIISLNKEIMIEYLNKIHKNTLNELNNLEFNI